MSDFSLLAMHCYHGLPRNEAIKEALAVVNASSKLNGLRNLRHRGARELAILRHTGVETQSQQSGAFASGCPGKGGCKFRFSCVRRTANRDDPVGTLGTPCFHLRPRKNSNSHA